jgi:heme exporter protein D
MARRLGAFAVCAALFETVSFIAGSHPYTRWIVWLLVAVCLIALAVLAVRGYHRQRRLSLPPSMDVKVVRRRHWQWF